jgi:hypothetical protein
VARLDEQAATSEVPNIPLSWIVPDETHAPESACLPERISGWWRLDLTGPPTDGSNLGMGVGLTLAQLVARLRQNPTYTRLRRRSDAISGSRAASNRRLR